MRFCTVVEAASCVLGVGWKSAFKELFFVLGGPTAPTGVERRSLSSPGPGSGNTQEVGLGLGLGQVILFLKLIYLLVITRFLHNFHQIEKTLPFELTPETTFVEV